MLLFEPKKQYFWHSKKDGAFYGIKLNSINKHGDYLCIIQDRVHDGWHTRNFIKQEGTIRTFKRKKLSEHNIDTDLDILIIDTLVPMFF